MLTSQKLSIIFAALTLLGVGCVRPPIIEGVASPAVPELCRTIMEGLREKAGLNPIYGRTGDFPTDFPAPPSGSTLCGTTDGEATLYLTTSSGAAVSGHYKTIFSDRGYFVYETDYPPIGGYLAVEKALIFTNETFASDGITGAIVTSPEGFFIVSANK